MSEQVSARTYNRKEPLWKVAAYCRVSPYFGKAPECLSAQMNHYRQLAKQYGKWQLVGIYTDDDNGNGIADRAGLEEMLADCREKKIDMIITKSINRFSHNPTEAHDMVSRLRKLGIDVYFETEHMHTASTYFQFLASVCGE